MGRDHTYALHKLERLYSGEESKNEATNLDASGLFRGCVAAMVSFSICSALRLICLRENPLADLRVYKDLRSEWVSFFSSGKLR
jgi:hypothetical protein